MNDKPPLSIAITHAEYRADRRASLARLMDLLGPVPAEVEVRVVPDPVGIGVWPVARQAWMAGIGMGAQWHLVLEDDFIPVHGMLHTLLGLVPRLPHDGRIVSGCTCRGWDDLIDARRGGWRWAITRGRVLGAQCLMAEPSTWMDAVIWSDLHVRPDYSAPDGRLSMFGWSEPGHDTWIMLPHIGSYDAGIVRCDPRSRDFPQRPVPAAMLPDDSAIDINYRRLAPLAVPGGDGPRAQVYRDGGWA